ncbi:hypothetical protein BC829DRAFT_392997 [Chytridium lagenaria]|nr:hypothetical protein BC829DRAFT_392997 [Chytridium lagenaria]
MAITRAGRASGCHPPVTVLYAIIIALTALVCILLPWPGSDQRVARFILPDNAPAWEVPALPAHDLVEVEKACHCPVVLPPKNSGPSESKAKPKHPKEPMDPLEYWSLMALVIFLVLLGGMFAGLTIGLMSIDETNLSILMKSGTPTEKMYAERIAPIRRDSHLLLVTLLLANTVVNETLPVLLGILDLEGYQAVIFSTALIVVFGDWRIPCMPVRIMIWIVYIIAYPIAKLLDYVLGHKGAIVYRRARKIKGVRAMHGEDHHGPLTEEEVTILRAVLELRDKTVVNVMTHMEDVIMLPLSAKLDRPTMHNLLQAGHSRVPVFNQFRDNIIGVVLVKQLVLLDPDAATPLADVPIGRLPRIRSDTPLFEILHVFEEGGSHMAVVVEEIPIEDNAVGSIITSSPLWVTNSPVLNARRFRTLGIVTLEDVIEEMIGQEIVDETDVYVDVGGKVKVARAFHEMERRLAKAAVLIKTPGGSSLPASPYLTNLDDVPGPVPSSPPPLPRTETTPLLSTVLTPPTVTGASSSSHSSFNYGTHPSPALHPNNTGSPTIDPMTPRVKGAKRRKDPLVPAALLSAGPLIKSRSGSVSERLEPMTPPAPRPSSTSPVLFVKIERDQDGIVVDGQQFLPNYLDLDNSSHRSSGSRTPSETVIDVEVSERTGSLERLD